MVKKQVQERHVQKTGNILRTVLIWVGLLVGITALLIEFLWPGNERAVLGMLAVVAVVYGMTLLDFDVDDDD